MRSAAVILGALFISTSCCAQTPTPIDFSGTWFNDRCSKMDLMIAGEQVTGSFVSQVGANPGIPFPIVGFRSGVDLLAFAVNFGATGSLGTWAGQHTLERGVEKIVSMWHLAVNVPDDKEDAELWSSVWTGADVFYRSKPAQCP